MYPLTLHICCPSWNTISLWLWERHMYQMQIIKLNTKKEKNSLLTGLVCKETLSHTMRPRHTPAVKVCVLDSLCVSRKTNNLLSHYTCFYVHKFFFKTYDCRPNMFLCFSPYSVLWKWTEERTSSRPLVLLIGFNLHKVLDTQKLVCGNL